MKGIELFPQGALILMGIDLQTNFDFDTVGEHFPYRSSQEQRPEEGYSTVGIGNLKEACLEQVARSSVLKTGLSLPICQMRCLISKPCSLLPNWIA